MADNEESKGALYASLSRNNSTIKADRAARIGEDAEIAYKRKVEDLRIEARRLEREQSEMLDLSPGSTTTLLMPNFEPTDFVTKHLNLGVKLYETRVRLKVAEEQYEFLFGKKVQ